METEDYEVAERRAIMQFDGGLTEEEVQAEMFVYDYAVGLINGAGTLAELDRVAAGIAGDIKAGYAWTKTDLITSVREKWKAKRDELKG